MAKAKTENQRAMVYKRIDIALKELNVDKLGIDERLGVEKMISELDYIKSCFAFSKVWKHEKSIGV